MISFKLTKFENDLMQLFFNLYPQWKKVITKQIQQATLQRERNISNYSVYFINDVKDKNLNIAANMPVEIILGNVEIPKESIINYTNGCTIISPSILSVQDRDAIGVRVYFSDGLLTELEIYSISGEELCEDLRGRKQCTYIVHASAE